MKAAFYILAVVLALIAVRNTNDSDVLPELVCVGFSFLCLWCGAIWNSVKSNSKTF